MYPHRKKSKGAKSGDLGGCVIGTPLPNQFASKLLTEKGFQWVGIIWRGSVLLKGAQSLYPCDCIIFQHVQV
jgi:hypothetical protein